MPPRNLARDLIRRATLRQLQVFETVARLSSFTRAAEELHLSQPTVSMQLKKLSDMIGHPLLEQAGIKVQLTDVGREAYSACQNIFETLGNLELRVADLKGLRRGSLRLAVITSAKYIAPHLLGRFCHTYPGVQVALKVTNRERLLDRITSHMDDLYILGRPPENLPITAHPLIPNPLVVMAARDHPLAGKKHISLERLQKEPFIMREPGSGTRAAIFRLFQQAGLPAPTTFMEFASNEAIKQAVVAGFGVTVLSRHSLVLEGTSGPIAILDVEGFPIERQWYVAHDRNKKLSVVAQAFLDFIKQESIQIAEKFNRELDMSLKSDAPKGGKRQKAGNI